LAAHLHPLAAPAEERVYTYESTSILNLARRAQSTSASVTGLAVPAPAVTGPAVTDLAACGPTRIQHEFREAWKRLPAGEWAAFSPYAGNLPDVTAALNALLTEFSAEIDRVERIKGKCILRVRKRTARTEWKKL
jgi:hypothetical protein